MQAPNKGTVDLKAKKKTGGGALIFVSVSLTKGQMMTFPGEDNPDFTNIGKLLYKSAIEARGVQIVGTVKRYTMDLDIPDEVFDVDEVIEEIMARFEMILKDEGYEPVRGKGEDSEPNTL